MGGRRVRAWKRKRIIIGEGEELKGSKGGPSYQEVEEDEVSRWGARRKRKRIRIIIGEGVGGL